MSRWPGHMPSSQHPFPGSYPPGFGIPQPQVMHSGYPGFSFSAPQPYPPPVPYLPPGYPPVMVTTSPYPLPHHQTTFLPPSSPFGIPQFSGPGMPLPTMSLPHRPPISSAPRNSFQPKPLPKKQEIFYCDSCEKELPHRNAYDQHNKTHVTCSFEGCNFVAIPKIVSEHYNSAHRDKNWGYNVTDIEQWKIERKKNYPSDDNVKKKAENIKNKTSSGAVAVKPNFKVSKVHHNEFAVPKASPVKNGVSSTSSGTTKRPEEEQQEEGQEGSTLRNGLVDDYVSEGEGTEEAPPSEVTTRLSHHEESKVPLLTPSSSHHHPQSVLGTKRKNMNGQNQQTNGKHNNTKTEEVNLYKKRKTSLVERMLADELQQEHNILLQCIRYLVQTQFDPTHEEAS